MDGNPFTRVCWPLVAVVENEPLAVCDARTVEDSDWEMIKKILDEAIEETMYMKRRERHKWSWMDKQTKDDVLALSLWGSSKPDSAREQETPQIDFNSEIDHVTDTSFAFSPTRLHKLLETRTTAYLRAFGGIRGLALGLRSTLECGLGVDEDVFNDVVTAQAALEAARSGSKLTTEPLHRTQHGSHGIAQIVNLESAEQKRYRDRKRVFGENRLPKPDRKSFLQLAWMAFNDKLIFLLTASATISLALGIYEAVVGSDDTGSNLEWVESVTIIAAILVIVLVSATNDYHKNYCFEKLNRKNEERWVTVLRSGKNEKISVFDILVGDILRLEAGDIVPVDGVLWQATGLHCDESSFTGEAEAVLKTPSSDDIQDESDPFIFSGTRVVQGVGSMLVTSVGANSIHGRMQLSLRAEVQETPLQRKLGRLAKYIIIAGSCIGTLFFLIIFIRWLVQLPQLEGTPEEKGKSFLDVFMLAVTVVLIGVPEGLSLAVAVALAFATTRMLKDKNLVRLLRSCETMGNATTVCSDKTGTLTMNQMSVVAGIIGTRGFGEPSLAVRTDEDGNHLRDWPVELQPFVQSLSDETKALLRNSFALNSTAFEQVSSTGTDFVGSSTEMALLRFGRSTLGMGPLVEERQNAEVIELLPFSPDRKWMAAVIKCNGKYRLLVKGAAEIVADKCSQILQHRDHAFGKTELLPTSREDLSRIIQDYAIHLLRPIALAYCDLESWPHPSGTDVPFDFDDLSAHQLTLIGILGIRDPLRPEVVSAVKSCHAAGVVVRMVTGDNFMTAKAIATECGIYTAGGIAMDGPTFRRLTSSQLDLIVPRLQVLARSSPDDKQVLVRHLQKLGEVVAVTGDGTNDAFALKAADVGFAMGIAGTDIAKEASAIVLIDDNFASIVKALAWGRAINDAARKFIQFQFTINITAGILTIISTLAGDIDAAVFAVIQLLWLNLIMDIFAALALATDFPTQAQMERRPEPRDASIVNIRMWKMILGQSIYQLIVVFTLHYAGKNFFTDGPGSQQLQTLVFNVYMFMQVFNQSNCRRVDNRLNIFEGVHKNPWFIAVQVITIGGQVAIILKGGNAFQVQALNGAQWGWSIFFGFLTLPIGMLIRLFPDEYALAIARKLKPLAWPIIQVTRWFRQRKAAKAISKQQKEDEYDEPDEERRIRRMQWIKSRKNKRANTTSGLKELDGDNPMSSKTTRMSDSNTQSQTSKVFANKGSTGDQEPIDLMQRLEAVRYHPIEAPEGFEVHPQTSKDDPILFHQQNGKVPPSQDPGVLKYLKFA
ncbi:Calcium-transporting ATPase [Paramyrothecium foliicola]|nr:Calcium-transporting ATPase [Paramyrothecium foliicola]